MQARWKTTALNWETIVKYLWSKRNFPILYQKAWSVSVWIHAKDTPALISRCLSRKHWINFPRRQLSPHCGLQILASTKGTPGRKGWLQTGSRHVHDEPKTACHTRHQTILKKGQTQQAKRLSLGKDGTIWASTRITEMDENTSDEFKPTINLKKKKRKVLAGCGGTCLQFQLLRKWRLGGLCFKTNPWRKFRSHLNQKCCVVMWTCHTCHSSYVGDINRRMTVHVDPGQVHEILSKKITNAKRLGLWHKW
jgi:hypothetical protein